MKKITKLAKYYLLIVFIITFNILPQKQMYVQLAVNNSTSTSPVPSTNTTSPPNPSSPSEVVTVVPDPVVHMVNVTVPVNKTLLTWSQVVQDWLTLKSVLITLFSSGVIYLGYVFVFKASLGTGNGFWSGTWSEDRDNGMWVVTRPAWNEPLPNPSGNIGWYNVHHHSPSEGQQNKVIYHIHQYEKPPYPLYSMPETMHHGHKTTHYSKQLESNNKVDSRTPSFWKHFFGFEEPFHLQNQCQSGYVDRWHGRRRVQNHRISHCQHSTSDQKEENDDESNDCTTNTPKGKRIPSGGKKGSNHHVIILPIQYDKPKKSKRHHFKYEKETSTTLDTAKSSELESEAEQPTPHEYLSFKGMSKAQSFEPCRKEKQRHPLKRNDQQKISDKREQTELNKKFPRYTPSLKPPLNPDIHGSVCKREALSSSNPMTLTTNIPRTFPQMKGSFPRSSLSFYKIPSSPSPSSSSYLLRNQRVLRLHQLFSRIRQSDPTLRFSDLESLYTLLHNVNQESSTSGGGGSTTTKTLTELESILSHLLQQYQTSLSSNSPEAPPLHPSEALKNCSVILNELKGLICIHWHSLFEELNSIV